MMSNSIIQSLWIGNCLSIVEQLCINSYLKNGHKFHLYTYTELAGVPAGTTLMDANNIIPLSEIFYDSRNTIASFSDWFRYKLLFIKGGWWTDLDNICIKPYDFKEDYCFSSQGIDNQNFEVNIGVIKSKQKSDFLSDCLTYIENDNHINIKWGQYGPTFFKNILSNFEHESFLQTPSTFCPIFYPSFRIIFEENFKLPNETYSVHLWNEMWRINKIDKNYKFKKNTLFEKLKELYLY
ncbi:hypothetical protein [Sphingobacterium faecium]|uniref:hypothetical protein n=1 Tax=Sphingobacterium faecium TaxID=34087 RepID=UPI0032085F63